jgi:hypothetical protein
MVASDPSKGVVMRFARGTSAYGYAFVAGVASFLLVAGRAPAQRTLSRAAYLDKLHGEWFGELIGNHTGRPFEGYYTTREPAPDSAFAWVVKTSSADPWTGDDDTAFEYLYLHTLETCGLEPTPVQIQTQWTDHVLLNGIYIANRQAWFLMSHGFNVPDTGSYRYNINAFAIDSQITTESLGAVSPGLRQWAIDAVGRFGGVTNSGYSLHAAQYYAAMYATAAVESNVDTIVQKGQECIPRTSRSWQVVQDVRDWYAADCQDGALDWRETRRKLYDYYVGVYSFGRYRFWIESTINLGITTMAILYGQGDFERTVRIAVLSGFDADCNGATAGGLIGMVNGYSALPAELTGPATDGYKLLYLRGLPLDETITDIAARMCAVGEQVIAASGGSVAGDTCVLPADDTVTPQPEKPDPPGPTGLVGAVRAAGAVTTDASVARRNPLLDRENLDSIIDGITDVTYNGHVPYYTYDGVVTQPPGGDYYQLNFSRRVRFDGLTYYEGDVLMANGNNDPRTTLPRGGYFADLTAEVHTDQGWVQTQHVTLSEPLDPYACFQVIDIGFDPVWGDGVRIRGTAGGAEQFTSIVELVARGALVSADVNGDSHVDRADLTLFEACWTGPAVLQASSACQLADFDGDGDVDQADFGILQRCFSGPACLPDLGCAD